MKLIEKEQGELETRKAELERQLSRRLLTKKLETSIRKMIEKLNTGLGNLDFNGRQQLLRLLIEKVVYDGQNIEIQTIIPPREKLHPVCRGGLRGRGCCAKRMP